jgi:outer membrane protein
MRTSAIFATIVAGLHTLTCSAEADAMLRSPQPRSIKANAEQMLILAEQMIQDGRAAQAESILQLLARDPKPDVRNEARYRQAMLLEARGENRGAAVLLRRILDDRPGAAPVRLKLATMLHKMGDESSALRELRALRTSELPPNVARFVDRMSASLQATKPLGFQVEIALAPDTNVNRATRSDTLGTVLGDFTLDEGSRARSGVGAAVRGFASARHGLSDDLRLVARASGEANLYRHKRFNDIALELAAGPEWRLGGTRFSAEAAIGQHWYGMKVHQRNLRIAASVTQPIDSVSQLRVDAGSRWSNNRVNDLQDGRGLSLKARYERALSPALLVAASLGADRFKARDDAYSTRSWNAGLAAYQEFGRMTLSASIEIGGLKADERLSLLPKAREDELLRVSVGSVFRQFTVAGFAPVTRLVFERNKSTVEFYDYKRTRTEFGISRAF